jgi:hypothetical protein
MAISPIGQLRPLAVFIGHDSREAEATEVCEFSMRKRSSAPLFVQRLSEPALRHAGLYWRQWKMIGNQRVDLKDNRPFSTLFAFSRFAVPSLMQHEGWALFVDSDFLFLSDVAEIFEAADPRFAVQVVMRGPMETGPVKMDGQSQHSYARKNWSSLILWNCGHRSNQRLTLQQVNAMSGAWLHGFSWLDDSEIGPLDPRWNWLSRVDQKPIGNPLAVHFTLGIPSFRGYEDSPYAEVWRDELRQSGERPLA